MRKKIIVNKPVDKIIYKRSTKEVQKELTIFDAIKKIRDLDYFKWNQYYRRYEFYVDKEYNHTKK